MSKQFDIVIAGGGLAGNCLARALADTELNIGLIEAQTREQMAASPSAERALALSAGTVNMLQTLHIWSSVNHNATPIRTIHVSDKGHFGKTRLSAAQNAVAALGYVINARDLEQPLAQLVETSGIQKFSPASVSGLQTENDAINIRIDNHGTTEMLSAKLLVGADGGNSTVRRLLKIAETREEYGQTAIVTTVDTAKPHRYTAYERFTASGPLAMLPLTGRRMSVVWTLQHAEAERLISVPEQAFITQLQQAFGFWLGELFLTGPRKAFPLNLVRAQTLTAGRTALIGNAAHQLHPVAGQGFNLGLRDVVQLGEIILDRHSQHLDIGSTQTLQQYADRRRQDHDQTVGFTNSVVRLFSNDWLPVAAARNAGLIALDHFLGAKNTLAKHAMGLAGRQPRVGSKR